MKYYIIKYSAEGVYKGNFHHKEDAIRYFKTLSAEKLNVKIESVEEEDFP